MRIHPFLLAPVLALVLNLEPLIDYSHALDTDTNISAQLARKSQKAKKRKRVRKKEQCRDGIDNDGDGLIDFGQDPGCKKSKDKSENSDKRPPTPQPSATPTPNPSPTPNPNSEDINVGDGASLKGRRLFPSDNPWNQDISSSPVDSNSANLIASIGLTRGLHADFGTVYNGAPNGIPYTVVAGNQNKSWVQFEYADESDVGPYPIPDNPPIEGGPSGTGDRHILILDKDNWMLYELFYARKVGATWQAGSGAIFNLNSNELRPSGWTSADAAGLPIFPGLVRYDEVMEQGEIKHALRFTVQRSRRAYVSPATHYASSNTDPNLPPMGMRVRLKANFDISGFPEPVQVILRALKKYGMFVADNGSNWFISGAPDPRWNDDLLSNIRFVTGQDFEVVQMGPVVTQ